eukprot:m.77372 g.77372  ORF g.77372 m.77372 type:complete len:403 (+) comp10607_c0_seq1:286-1494(+)
MHPRNRYANVRHDFDAMATSNPVLRPFVRDRSGEAWVAPPDPASPGSAGAAPAPAPQKRPKYRYDFSQAGATTAFTTVLLERDFGLRLDLPQGQLAPTLPQKLNYIHWIEDLIALPTAPEVLGMGCSAEPLASAPLESAGSKIVREAGKGEVVGVDIGTGCSSIYPLLVTSLHPDWIMIATELSDVGREYASKNIAANKRQDRISLVDVDNPLAVLRGTVFPADFVLSNPPIDFCMCNPPFFDLDEPTENRSGRRGTRQHGKAGSDAEMMTVGGEAGFVGRLIEDSLELKHAVRWYTSMLGKKASIKTLQRQLLEHGFPTILRATFEQGKTHRWALAWSYSTIVDWSEMPHGTTVVVGDRVKQDSSPSQRKRKKSAKLAAGKRLKGEGGQGEATYSQTETGD